MVVERAERYESALAVIRLVLGLGALVAIVSILAWRYHDPLARFGTWFVTHFGLAGMLLGALLADGVHFPVPPQFYLFTGVAAGYDELAVLLAVLVGSELGGLVAFTLGRRVGAVAIVARAIARPRTLLEGLFARQGYVGLAIATLLPISYCLVCLTTGAMRLPYRAYAVLAVVRVPKIVLSYVVIALAWHS